MKYRYLLLTFLVTTSTFLGVWYTAWTEYTLPVGELYETNSCTTKSNIYLNEDNDADGKADFGGYLNNNFMLNCLTDYNNQPYAAGQIFQTSTVEYFMPLTNMLYKIYSGTISAIDENTFWKVSRVFPCNTPVRGIASTPNKIIFEQPEDNDTGKNIVSFVYNYVFSSAKWFKSPTTTSNYRYNQISNMNNMSNSIGVTYHSTLPGNAGNKTRQWWAYESKVSCVNYNLHRCGDGKKDTRASGSGWATQFTWELCDDGPLNGTAWYCVAGCGNGWWQERCGDEIIQTAWNPYNWDANNISFEECDDGDEEGDTDGLLNGDDAATSFCSTICLPTFAEEFTEEFVNE